jgi:hypothetical protein
MGAAALGPDGERREEARFTAAPSLSLTIGMWRSRQQAWSKVAPALLGHITDTLKIVVSRAVRRHRR